MALVRARQGMATATRVIPAGAHIDDQDPIVLANPLFFEPIRVAGSVEQATAAPGEVRNTPAKKAPAKKAARRAST